MTTTATVRVIELTEPTELYRHYQGEHQCQPAYVELDLRAGTLLASYNTEVGNAVPFSVAHGFERRYTISTVESAETCVPTAEAANRLMEEIVPLAARMLADWEEYWDGNNTVARLGEDALAAEEGIEALTGAGWDEDDLVGVWEDGAISGSEVAEYGITADTTDERLDEIEASILADMRQMTDSGVAVLEGVDTYLRNRRDELKAEADEDE